jgi:hypothetical protein
LLKDLRVCYFSEKSRFGELKEKQIPRASSVRELAGGRLGMAIAGFFDELLELSTA